jgi:hypothetical protein
VFLFYEVINFTTDSPGSAALMAGSTDRFLVDGGPYSETRED